MAHQQHVGPGLEQGVVGGVDGAPVGVVVVVPLAYVFARLEFRFKNPLRSIDARLARRPTAASACAWSRW